MSDQPQVVCAKGKRGRLDPNARELCAPEQSLREGSDAPRGAVLAPQVSGGAKHRRGAQPGNKNAFRHGFYAKNLGLISPTELDEFEMRNLLGEAAMLKDYMYILYNCNLAVRDSTVLAETLRGLALAGMALSRLLQVHNDIRLFRDEPSSSLKSLLSEMDAATSHANRLSRSITRSKDLDALLDDDA